MAPTMDIESHPLDGGVELVLTGELDISSVPQLRDELRRLRKAEVPLVRLDISALDFVDSTGLRSLLEAAEDARVHGWKLALSRAPPHVQHMFELTQTEDVLPFEAKPPEG
jgi:anti-anti-sigma factor